MKIHPRPFPKPSLSNSGLGAAEGERAKACFGGSEMSCPAGHAALPEAARSFWRSRFSRADPGPLGNLLEALGSHKDTPHSNSPQLAERAPRTHTHTHRCSIHPLSLPSYPLVTSLFYFLKTRQFKRRKCSKLAHGKKWQKETVPLYQASNSRAGKGVSIQYVPDS